MKRMILLLLLVPFVVWAEISITMDAQIQQREAELARIQQEAQATFQQFQMIQELRRNELQTPSIPISVPPGMSATSVPIPKYEDTVKREQEKYKRIEQYTADLNRLYKKYTGLEEQRKALIEEIDQLKQIPYQEE